MSRFSLVDLRPSLTPKAYYISRDKRASSMVALARNLDLIGSRFLTGLPAVFVTRLRQAPAWQMRTLVLLICRHHSYCSPFPTAVFIIVVAGLLWRAQFPALQTLDLL